MDTEKIYEEALRMWRTVSVGDLENASWDGSAGGDLLLIGDNLSLMAAITRQIGEGARKPLSLIYMDPPYFSNRDPGSRLTVKTPSGESVVTVPAFSDTWPGTGMSGSAEEAMEAYLAMLIPRVIAAHELLAEDGSLWIHLDRRAVHYVKVMADAAFGGQDHFINEIVWAYKSGGSSTKRFSNKHDTLLFYAKNKKKYKFFPQEEKSYNRGLKPYRFKGVKEYRDDYGWYTIVNMKDVWEIPMVGRTAGERTGYATQKPEALLERIVLACTEEGDTCMDPFGGSGTLAAVCAKNDRGWVYIDESPMAAEICADRLGMKPGGKK